MKDSSADAGGRRSVDGADAAVADAGDVARGAGVHRHTPCVSPQTPDCGHLHRNSQQKPPRGEKRVDWIESTLNRMSRKEVWLAWFWAQRAPRSTSSTPRLSQSWTALNSPLPQSFSVSLVSTMSSFAFSSHAGCSHTTPMHWEDGTVQGRRPLLVETRLAFSQVALPAGQPASGAAEEGEEYHHRLHGSDFDVSHQQGMSSSLYSPHSVW